MNGPSPKFSDADFIAAWRKLGSVTLISAALSLADSTVRKRRRECEHRYGIKLPTWNDLSTARTVIKRDEGRVDLNIDDGVVIVFSDAHYWPNVRTTAHRALLAMIRQLKPVAVICNGDAFDGGTISRYPRIGWDKNPTVIEELNAVKSALDEVESCVIGAELIWPLGNHDARYETKLAASAPEFEGVAGFHLKDHFPRWRPCWTVWVNDETCITHFYHTGIHDTHNNVLKGQCHYVSGHTHSLKVTPWTDARGHTKYGVNTGTLADALGKHNVDYQGGRHGNHRSGFAVLTYRDGQLLMPELVIKHDEDTIEFRGHILDADSGAVL